MTQRWSQADLDAHLAKKSHWSAAATKRAHKYHAKGTDVDGIHFPSALEARCYEQQKFRRDVIREVLWFTRQVPFYLPGGIAYRLDFLCALANGGVDLIDAKGFDTEIGKLKRKQVESIYGVKIQLWRGE